MARTVEVVVGVVGRPHGIRGELGVDVRTDEPETRFAVGAVLHAESAPHRHWEVLGRRWHSDRLLVRLSGITDRTQAEALRGVRLAVTVPADQRPDDDEEFYDHQLVGLAVHDHGGRVVGRVAEVVHLPSQDLLAITLDAGQDAGKSGEERLVPFVAALVTQVDLTAGTVTLADVPGLLADTDEASESADES